MHIWIKREMYTQQSQCQMSSLLMILQQLFGTILDAIDMVRDLVRSSEWEHQHNQYPANRSSLLDLLCLQVYSLLSHEILKFMFLFSSLPFLNAPIFIIFSF